MRKGNGKQSPCSWVPSCPRETYYSDGVEQSRIIKCGDCLFNVHVIKGNPETSVFGLGKEYTKDEFLMLLKTIDYVNGSRVILSVED